MEVKGGHNRKCTVMICECLGTALFIYGIIMTGTASTIPFSLFASILLFGAITGGHFNPAVSLGVFLGEGKNYGENFGFLMLIWLGQFLGGGLAMGLSYLSLYDTQPPPTTVPAALVPRLCPQEYPVHEGITDCDNWDGRGEYHFAWQVLVNEIVCTFIFVSVILMVKLGDGYVQVTKDGISGALGVALTLLAMITTGGKLGACYNPAVAVTLTGNAVTFLDDETGYLKHYAPYYFIGPLLGAALAGVFHIMHKNVL